MGRGGPSTSRHVVRSVLAGINIGVDAHRVVMIEDLVEIAAATRQRALDLALHLGVDEVEVQSERRVIVVEAAGERRNVIVGPLVRIEKLTSEGVLPVPAFLDGISRKSALAGIFRVGDELGFFLDVERLVSTDAAQGVA